MGRGRMGVQRYFQADRREARDRKQNRERSARLPSTTQGSARKASSYMIASMFLVLSGMMTTSVSAAKSNFAKTTHSKSVIIHKRTPYFIDIEEPIDQVWVG